MGHSVGGGEPNKFIKLSSINKVVGVDVQRVVDIPDAYFFGE